MKSKIEMKRPRTFYATDINGGVPLIIEKDRYDWVYEIFQEKPAVDKDDVAERLNELPVLYRDVAKLPKKDRRTLVTVFEEGFYEGDADQQRQTESLIKSVHRGLQKARVKD